MTYIKKLKFKLEEDKELLKKIIFTSFTRGIAAIGTFVFNFTLAKFLGVNDFGSFSLIYSIFIGLSIIIRYGCSTAIIRFGSIFFENKQFNNLSDLKRKVNKDVLLKSIVIGSIICVASPLISFYLFKTTKMYNVFVTFAFSIPFYSYLTIQSSYLKAFKKPELAPFIEVGISSFLTGSILLLIALIGFKINLFISSLSFLISCVIVYFIGSKILKNIITNNRQLTKHENDEKFNFKEYNNSLFDYFTTDFTTYLFKFSPILILGYYASSKEVGLYTLTNSTAFIINFILFIFSTVYAPHFSILYKNKSFEKLKELLFKSILYMSFLAVPIFIILVTFPDLILSIFGEKYAEAKNGLIIMAVAQLFNVLTGPVYFLLNMTGHQRKLRTIVLLTSIFCITLSLILIPKYGYFGAVISTSIGLIIQNSFSFYHSKKILGISFFKK